MRLELVVTGKTFGVDCIRCHKEVTTGDESQGSGYELQNVYADLDGEPFKAYYCEPCAAEMRGKHILYAVTHIGNDGLRVLTFANQGRNHFDSYQVAKQNMEAFRKGLESVIGDAVKTLEVRPVECYESGDAMGIYFGLEVQS